jgi:hypothetical protein
MNNTQHVGLWPYGLVECDEVVIECMFLITSLLSFTYYFLMFNLLSAFGVHIFMKINKRYTLVIGARKLLT